MKWNSELYDKAQAYVSEYGRELINLIPHHDDLCILDLGCGTGDLTNEIATHYRASIIGTDYSKEMIDKAKEKYPRLSFYVCDALSLPYENEFDVVFSNAVLHWITKQDELHTKVRQVLKARGIFICEFGAVGNISAITEAFRHALSHYGDSYESPFYFPTCSEHQQLLELHGFDVWHIHDFDRPTKLPHASRGLSDWVRQFFSAKLNQYSQKEQNSIIETMEHALKDSHFDGENWIADYRRIRIVAQKV